jgi:hypothetical protein
MKSLTRYQILKWLAISLLVSYLILRLLFPEANIFIDLVLFNLIGLLAAAIAFNAPVISDHYSTLSMGSAYLIWTIGSFLSTWDSFFNSGLPEWFSEASYSFFIH